MSYSLSRIAATKDALSTAIEDALKEVPTTQSVHEIDILQAIAAAKSFIDLTFEDAEHDLCCSVSGSIYKTEAGVQACGVNISVSHLSRA